VETYTRWAVERIVSLALAARRLLAQRWVRTLSYALVATVVLWWFVTMGRNLPSLVEQIHSLDTKHLFFSYVLLLTAAGISGARWPLIIRTMGSNCQFGWLFRVWFLAQAARHIPGGIWNYASALALTSTKIQARTTVGAYVVDALLRLAGDAIIIAFLLIALYQLQPYWLLGISLLYLILLCLAYLVLSKNRARDAHAPGCDNGARDSTQLLADLSVCKLGLPFAVSVASSLFLGWAFFFLVRSFPQTSQFSPGAAIWSLTVSDAAGFIAPFAPGGLGVKEGLLAYWLAESVPNLTALAIAGFSRIWFLSAEAVWVIAMLCGSRLGKGTPQARAMSGTDLPRVD